MSLKVRVRTTDGVATGMLTWRYMYIIIWSKWVLFVGTCKYLPKCTYKTIDRALCVKGNDVPNVQKAGHWIRHLRWLSRWQLSTEIHVSSSVFSTWLLRLFEALLVSDLPPRALRAKNPSFELMKISLECTEDNVVNSNYSLNCLIQ